MTPIYGPFNSVRTNNYDGPGSFRIEKRTFRQTQPYDLPTVGWRSYHTYTLDATSNQPGGTFGGMANASSVKGPWWAYAYKCDTTTNELVAAHERCYDRFVNQIHANAGALINLYQRQQAISMMNARMLQMVNLIGNLRRGRFNSYLKRELKEVKRKGAIRTLADDFLELHFGWEPLVNDIGTAVEILQSPIAKKAYWASAKRPVKWSISSTPHPNYWSARHDGDAIVRMQADVEVTNPNLALAASLGFTNPASVVWDAIPFSFLVDWFLPIGRFLNSWSDFHGLKLTNPVTTYFGRIWTESQYFDYGAPGVPGVSQRMWIKSHCSSAWRESGISAGLPYVKPAHLSVSRAMTSWSLLVQQLSRISNTRSHFHIGNF